MTTDFWDYDPAPAPSPAGIWVMDVGDGGCVGTSAIRREARTTRKDHKKVGIRPADAFLRANKLTRLVFPVLPSITEMPASDNFCC
jgi:hypothetical protein